jgi:hypothetical protein
MSTRAKNTDLLITYAIACCEGKFFSRDDAAISCTYTYYDTSAKRRVLCMLYVVPGTDGRESDVWARQVTKTKNMQEPFMVGTLGDLRLMRDLGAFDVPQTEVVAK